MLLIDVYNVLHTTGVLPPDLAGMDVPELAKLSLAGRYARLEIILVCDGTGGGASSRGIDQYRQTGGSGIIRPAGDRSHHSGRTGRRGTVAVVYAGKGMEADTVIDIMIRGGGRGNHYGSVGSGAYGKPIVVSSDRAVRASARRARARAILSEDFLQHLVDDWKRSTNTGGGGHQPRPRAGADDRPGFARKTPLDRYTVEEWLAEFGFGATGPTQAEWDAMLAELGANGSNPSGEAARVRPNGEITEHDSSQHKPKPRPSGATSPPASTPAPSNDIPAAPSAGPGTTTPPDPIMRAAMKAWPGRVNPDDLDMEKWIQNDERLT